MSEWRAVKARVEMVMISEKVKSIQKRLFDMERAATAAVPR